MTNGLYRLDNISPSIHETAWLAPGAQIMGDVSVLAEASVWFNAVLRGDNERITIGARSNVQDGCVLHTDPGFPLNIGAECTIGHNVVAHGCEIGEGALIGMGATVLNGAKIGAECLVGANALITEGKEFPTGSLIVGSPARVVRSLDAAARAELRASAQRYAANARRFRLGLERL